MELALQLAVSTVLVMITVAMHLAGLAGLLIPLRRHPRWSGHGERRFADAIGLIAAALGLFVLHAVEIWTYALFYWLVGALPAFGDALYFSTSTYATIGFGDLVLGRWRVVSAIEGINGIILLGWSTAFFVTVVNRIRLLESEPDRR